MPHALNLETCLWVLAVRRCSEMEAKTEEEVGISMCSARHKYKAPVYLVHFSTLNIARVTGIPWVVPNLDLFSCSNFSQQSYM